MRRLLAVRGTLLLFLAVGLGFSPVARPAAAPKPAPSIWGDPIAKQPFDTQVFRPIKVPAWLEDTVGCGYTLSVMDRKGRVAAAKHGVKISEMGFVDPFYAYYDSKLLKRRSPHVPLGRLEKDIADYKELGVRILAVYPPCLQAEAYENHPDWRRIATNTTTIPSVDMKKEPHGGMLCLLGPLRRFLHRCPRRDPDQVPRRVGLQLRRASLRRRLLL